MRAATAGFAAAQAGTDTIPKTRVTFTWGPPVTTSPPTDFSKALTSVQPSADLTTDMPQGTRDIVGYPARTASMVLAGTFNDDASETAQWLFDDYSTDSPLYGIDWTGADNNTEVLIEQGLEVPGQADEYFPIFTGYVTTFAINRATGEVNMTMIDTRVQLSAVPTIPEVVAGPADLIGDGQVVWAPGLTALWPLDYVLRANGIYSSPPPRAGCIAYQSMHGSLYPEVGDAAAQDGVIMFGSHTDFDNGTNAPLFVPGFWAGQVADGGISQYFVSNAGNLITGDGYFIEFWVNFDDERFAIHDELRQISIELGEHIIGASDLFVVTVTPNFAGQPGVTLDVYRGASETYGTIPLQATGAGFGWHQITVQVLYATATTATVQFWDNGTSVGTQTLTIPAVGSPTTVNIMQLLSNYPVDTFQIVHGTGTPTTGFVQQALLDASLNPLDAIPSAPGSDAWAIINQLMDAERGIAGFDETTIFFFRNRYNRPTASQLIVTSKSSLKDLTFERNEANRASTVNAAASPQMISAPTVVWQTTKPTKIAASSVYRFSAITANAVVSIAQTLQPIPVAGLTADAKASGYLANTTADGTGVNITNLYGSVIPVGNQEIIVEIHNDNPFPVWLAPTTGYSTAQGVFVIYGRSVLAGSVVNVSASYGGGRPQLTLATNQWLQRPDVAQALVDDELADLVRPRPMATNVLIVGDPRLQLADRVTIVDGGESATNAGPRAPAAILDDYLVTAVHPNATPGGGFTQTLVARAIASPRQWVLGVAGKSEMGASTWL